MRKYPIKHGIAAKNRKLPLYKLYGVWRAMRDRCYYKKNRHYPSYGGRGITVCDEWRKDFRPFLKWSLKKGYKRGLTIDRINNDGNYEPSNCRWVTQKEQMNNTSVNHFLTAFGETKTIAQWAEDPRCVVSKWCLNLRISRYKMLPERALTIPLLKYRKYITAFGEQKTLKGWSEDHRCVISKKRLFSRLKAEWEAEKAISTPPTKKGSDTPIVILSAFGEKKSMKDWSRDKRCVVQYRTLHNRIKYQKREPEDAITTPLSVRGLPRP